MIRGASETVRRPLETKVAKRRKLDVAHDTKRAELYLQIIIASANGRKNLIKTFALMKCEGVRRRLGLDERQRTA
jgi:hypothetical protein